MLRQQPNDAPRAAGHEDVVSYEASLSWHSIVINTAPHRVQRPGTQHARSDWLGVGVVSQRLELHAGASWPLRCRGVVGAFGRTRWQCRLLGGWQLGEQAAAAGVRTLLLHMLHPLLQLDLHGC